MIKPVLWFSPDTAAYRGETTENFQTSSCANMYCIQADLHLNKGMRERFLETNIMGVFLIKINFSEKLPKENPIFYVILLTQ